MSSSALLSGANVQRFGRYEVIARVARGGMGTVFLARAAGEGGFNRLFILKVIHQHLGNDEAFIAMMQKEARIAARLHHPNVVSLVDVGTSDESFYIVMDYVEGCTLADLLNHHASNRPANLLVPILLDVLSGLHAAHRLEDDEGRPLNLVHRDVSPENMLIGVDGHCRLIDFGIVKAGTTTQVTNPGVLRGKPAYMSPEQVSSKSIDHRSDIFSTGVVLYNALTGRRLFDGTSTHATIYNILKRRIPRPSQTGLCPPACFDAICLKALERNPDKRFQSAEEMAEALRDVALRSGNLAPASQVSTFIEDTFGAKLELRKERTRDFLRARASESGRASPVLALPELTLSVSTMQPALTPTHTENEALLTWDELSPPTHTNPSGEVPMDPMPSTTTPVELLTGADYTHLAADHQPPGKARNAVLLGGAAGVVTLLAAVGIYALFGGDDERPTTQTELLQPAAPSAPTPIPPAAPAAVSAEPAAAPADHGQPKLSVEKKKRLRLRVEPSDAEETQLSPGAPVLSPKALGKSAATLTAKSKNPASAPALGKSASPSNIEANPYQRND